MKCDAVGKRRWPVGILRAAAGNCRRSRRVAGCLYLFIDSTSFRRRSNLMTGTGTRICVLIRQLGLCVALAAALGTSVRSAYAVVVYTDGFGDADRNNDGAITSYDTDWNDNGTFNDATADAALIARGITEVTA